MNNKQLFLDVLGIDIPLSAIQHDILVSRHNEQKPFCAIVTDKNGRTHLKVGDHDIHTGIRVTI